MTQFFLASQDNDTIVRVEGLVTKVAGVLGPKSVDEFVSGQEMTEHSGWVTVRDPGWKPVPLVSVAADDGS